MFDVFSHFEPVGEVVAHVVAAERQHGHGVAADLAHGSGGGGCGFRAHRGSEIHTVDPVEGLENERHRRGATSTEDHRAHGHAGGVFPIAVDERAVFGRGREAAVRVAAQHGFSAGICLAGSPDAAEPVDEVRGRFFGHALPPDIAVIGECNIGENGVAGYGIHRHRVACIGGSGCDAEKSRLRVDGAEVSVGAGLDPGDIVTHAADLPAFRTHVGRGNHHGEIRLSAGAGECGSDIGFLSIGGFYAQDEHVFSQPALIAGHGGGDAQGEAFFPKEGIAAVSRAEAHHKPFLGEVGDVGVLGIAWPGDILRRGCERRSHRVEAFHKGTGFFDFPIHGRAQAGHDPHVGHDIGAVGNFDTILGDRGADRAHAEGNDIHRPTAHAACKEVDQAGFHLFRRLPVVGGAGVFLRVRADECAFFHAGDIAWVAADEQGIRPFLCVQPHARARGHDRLAHGEVFGFRAIAPVDGIGAGEGGDFLHPAGHGWRCGVVYGLR